MEEGYTENDHRLLTRLYCVLTVPPWWDTTGWVLLRQSPKRKCNGSTCWKQRRSIRTARKTCRRPVRRRRCGANNSTSPKRVRAGANTWSEFSVERDAFHKDLPSCRLKIGKRRCGGTEYDGKYSIVNSLTWIPLTKWSDEAYTCIWRITVYLVKDRAKNEEWEAEFVADKPVDAWDIR